MLRDRQRNSAKEAIASSLRDGSKVEKGDGCLIVDGKTIKIFTDKDPASIPSDLLNETKTATRAGLGFEFGMIHL